MDQIVLNELMTNLKKVKYKNIIQDLKLNFVTDDCTYIYLSLIRIKKSQRCQGWGSAVMSELIQLADKENVQLRLYATNVYGAELRRLYGFYRKHGFVLENDQNDGKFIYRPKKH